MVHPLVVPLMVPSHEGCLRNKLIPYQTNRWEIGFTRDAFQVSKFRYKHYAAAPRLIFPSFFLFFSDDCLWSKKRNDWNLLENTILNFKLYFSVLVAISQAVLSCVRSTVIQESDHTRYLLLGEKLPSNKDEIFLYIQLPKCHSLQLETSTHAFRRIKILGDTEEFRFCTFRGFSSIK